MYAESGLLFPYLQSYYAPEFQHVEDFCRIHRSNERDNLLQTSTLSEYDLGAEGDLFKAPEPINSFVDEPIMELDPLSATISMISVGEDISSQSISMAMDMDSMQSDPLLSEVFYECKKELLAKSAITESVDEVPDIKIPAVQIEEDLSGKKDKSISEWSMQKSVSSGCLNSLEWINGKPVRPNFQGFQEMDSGVVAFRMRRAFSEGDIQTLGSVITPVPRSPFAPVLTIGNYTIEERKQRLSRYRKKKSKRNFGRKIKYECRKALADSQPRVRGRFAKTEEAEVSHPSK